MTPDQYVYDVLNRHQSASSILVANNVINSLTNSITTWANGHLNGVYVAGSIAKGTAISESSDVDILISVNPTATETLKEVYEKLFNRFTADGLSPKRQNVSLGLDVSGWKVDVVPAKKQSLSTNDHSLWSHKSQARRETNIHNHVKYVADSQRLNEIKLLKIWRKLHNLEFPSFPLEITVINVLSGRSTTTPSANFVKVLEFIRDSMSTARVLDPTKPSNILSDKLTATEKNVLSISARESLGKNWEHVVW